MAGDVDRLYVEVTVPLDTNLQKAYKEKQIKYIHLTTRLQQLYKNYKYTTIIITVRALGGIPKLLEENLKNFMLKTTYLS